MLSGEAVRRALDEIPYPGFRHSIVRYGMVGDIQVSGTDVAIRLFPASRNPEKAAELLRRVEERIRRLAGVGRVQVEFDDRRARSAEAEPRPAALPGVRTILAVSSCKGGVGKSTVAVNLAVALRLRGAAVGLLDADVYGPSVPLMLGLEARPRPAGGKVTPLERYGVSSMSMGFFLDDRSPVIWRGPMVIGLIRQFLEDVEWGTLDVLVVDMPPGTGDAALTLAQHVALSGALIVTTPQEVALRDVERGVGMFRRLQVPVLGVVENMSVYECPQCGEREALFGSGGGDLLSREFGIPVLARLPLAPEIRIGGDLGRPIVIAAPEHPASRAFLELAGIVEDSLGLRAGLPGTTRPAPQGAPERAK